MISGIQIALKNAIDVVSDNPTTDKLVSTSQFRRADNDSRVIPIGQCESFVPVHPAVYRTRMNRYKQETFKA